MRKKYLFLIIFNIIGGSGFVFTQNFYELNYERTRYKLELKIPYQLNMKISRIFHEDTILAIKILEMKVDGKQIFPEFDGTQGSNGLKMKTKLVNKKLSIFYMRMIWIFSDSSDIKEFTWSDGRSYDSYIIREGSKNLFIRYKIIFPFPFVTVKKLKENNIPENSYSEEYCVSVDLTNAFMLGL